MKHSINKKGFTIIELVIVAIVMGILMSIGGRTYYNEKDRFEYNNALSEVLQIIKQARNSATTSQSHLGKVPPDGYGIYINLKPAADEPHVIRFVSLGKGSDGSFSIPNKTFDHETVLGLDDQPDKILEEYRFPDQVHFEYLSFDFVGAGLQEQWAPGGGSVLPAPLATEAVIFFRPPLAETYLGGWVGAATNPNNEPTDLEALSLRLFNASAQAKSSPKKCQHINMTRLKTFPSINYSDCSEFDPRITY